MDGSETAYSIIAKKIWTAQAKTVTTPADVNVKLIEESSKSSEVPINGRWSTVCIHSY